MAFAEAETLYPEWFGRFVADGAFDALPIYLYLEERGVEAVIDLNAKGRAVCRSGHEMTKRGSSHHGQYTQWSYPLKKRGTLQCPAPCFYKTHAASLRRDLRLQPRIPRGSAEWDRAMDDRTAAERFFSHLKGPLGLENGRHRSDSVWTAHTVLAGIAMHVQAWAGVLDPAFDTASAT